MGNREVGLELQCLHHLMRRRADALLADCGLQDITRMQSFVIHFLRENQERGDLFQRDVEKQFNIRRATATGILQVMEREGLLRREPVDYDARLKKLILTPEAIELDENILRSIQSAERQMMAGILPEELEVFWRVLDQMKKNLEQAHSC